MDNSRRIIISVVPNRLLFGTKKVVKTKMSYFILFNNQLIK